MRLEIVEAAVLPRHAASRIATLLTDAVSDRGIASLAVSGGSTPAAMLRELAQLRVPWEHVHVFQVDERIAPDGDPDRNLGDLERELLEPLDLTPAGVHPMPVAGALDDPAEHDAADRYASVLREVAGDPVVLDVVHLGLGDDGHTASLVPGDPALDVDDRDVAVTGTYQGRRRLTLTYPVLRRARALVYLVAGAGKAGAVRQLVDQDPAIPAGRLPDDRAVLLLDPDAASGLR